MNRCMCGEAKLEGKVVAVVIERDQGFEVDLQWRKSDEERERGVNEERIGCAWINFTLQTLVTVVQASIPPRRSKI